MRRQSDNSAITVSARGGSTPIVDNASSSTNNNSRVCFLATSDLAQNTDVFVVDIDATGDVWIRCDETTLYGSWNLNFTEFNFLELTNIGTSEDVNVTVKAYAYMGDIARADIVEDFEIRQRRRADLDLHTPIVRDIGTSVNFGHLIIAHNGAPGSLIGHVTRYQQTSTDPFEIQPVSQLPVSPR